MHIAHVALWTADLERMKEFYATYFNAIAGEKYRNPSRQFESYLLSFSGGATLELMSEVGLPASDPPPASEKIGYAHIALGCGSRQAVEHLIHRLEQDGFTVVSPPRLTGDGYYESVVLDPDGNRVEITL